MGYIPRGCTTGIPCIPGGAAAIGRSLKANAPCSALLAFIVAVAGCAGPGPLISAGARTGDSAQSATPKQVTAAIMGVPKAFGLGSSLSAVPGEAELTELVNSGLSTTDSEGRTVPRLAEAVPSAENGLWKVFPDGRMETIWKIRSGAHWHDGVPFTADDLVFSSQVIQDKSLAIAARLEYQSIESMETLDPSTFTVRWKAPYLHADTLLGSSRDSPLPRHLLESPYAENKAAFLTLPYWTNEFIGSGPYLVREWVPDSHLVVQADEQYVLGRPKVATVEVRFIPDGNTLIANVLAGTVQLSMGRGISLEQALQIRDQWTSGRLAISVTNPLVLYPQFQNTIPAVAADARFRQAMLHAIDRQGMVDTLLGGLSRIAYGALLLSDEDRKDLDPSIVRYPYDPRRAGQLIEELGYRKDTEGLFRDGAGRTLAMELNTDPSNDIQVKSTFVIANYWQRLGVGVDPVVLPQQQLQDPRWKSDYRAFSLRKQPINLDRLEANFHSGQIPLPENNFRGANYPGYVNPDLDALIGKFFATVPRGERMAVASQIVHILSDQLVIVGLFYDVEVVLINGRMKNVTGRGLSAGESWNAHDWDID